MTKPPPINYDLDDPDPIRRAMARGSWGEFRRTFRMRIAERKARLEAEAKADADATRGERFNGLMNNTTNTDRKRAHAALRKRIQAEVDAELQGENAAKTVTAARQRVATRNNLSMRAVAKKYDRTRGQRRTRTPTP